MDNQKNLEKNRKNILKVDKKYYIKIAKELNL